MVITESNISVLGCVKNKDSLPQLIITSMINHKWKTPYTCDYKNDVKNHERIVELLSSEPFYAADRIEEYAWLVCMKTHGELIGVYELSHGGLNTTIMDYRIIMMKAIIAGSAHMVIAHNHPTGNPTPSEADKILTKELNDIATLHNIDLYDHIIIGKNGWESVFKVIGLQNHDNFDFTHQAIYPDDIQVNEMERDSMNKEACENFINFCDNMTIANEKLSTRILDKTLSKYMTLYHGTREKYDVIKATSVNLGNRLETGHLSSFWVNNFDYARVWALDWRMKEGYYAHDIDRNKFLVRTEPGIEDDLREAFAQIVNEHPVYVCEAKIPVKYIGRGQMMINEYTVNHDVIPGKWYELKWKDVEDIVEFTPTDEFDKLVATHSIDIRRKQKSLAEKLIFRGDREIMNKRMNNYQMYNSIYALKKALIPNKTIDG